MPEFEMGQRVRVREEGGAPGLQPDKRFLGKEGTVQYSTGIPLEGDPLTFYSVEFDSGEVELINPRWLESVE